VTLARVAEAAGVSQGAVSLALNGRGRISLEVRERVSRIAEELGYRPRRGMRSGSPAHIGTIAVLLERRAFDLVDSYYFQILRGVQAAAEEQGFKVVFSTVSSDQVQMGWRAGLPEGVQPGGAIVLGVTAPEFVEACRSSDVPVVFASAAARGVSDFDTVVSDDFQAMEAVFRHLTAEGHRQIAFVGATMDRLSSINRLRAFKIQSDEFLGSCDSRLIEVADEGAAQAAGFETCSGLLAKRVPFTALVCMDDEMARGAIEALVWSGVRVPEDVSVVGFDNKEVSQIINPPLTTVQINCHTMGKIACELLVLRMRDLPKLAPLHVLVAPELVVRSSTAAPVPGPAAWTRSRYAQLGPAPGAEDRR
jgi:DNA-binding LacI/PurR family transcriptional regulator